jgi:hypothetical protein
MSLALGLKALHRVHTLGQKAHLVHSFGKKLGRVGYNLFKGQPPKAIPSVAGEGSNNMIYNKSNLGDAQYIPFGMKKMITNKKSYLEKR